MKRSLAAVGSVSDPQCWSGIPYHFWQEARSINFATEPWEVNLSRITWQRWLWNAGRRLGGQGSGGFQYSKWFLDLLESQVPDPLWQTEIITFNQHFPRAKSVKANGGVLNHYLDAPFAALVSGRGLDLKLPSAGVKEALALERENYAASERIIMMARWAATVVIEECDVAREKVHIILPGANLDLPNDWMFSTPEGRAGKERDFTLGFVGKDWKRKGLPLLVTVREELERRGWRSRILVIGEAPAEWQKSPGIEYAGYVEKQNGPRAFLNLLSRCDVGCLFSEREALGISTLEFLRAGIPVAGFDHEGTADTIPPDAGFRFTPGSTALSIADRFDRYLQNETEQAACRATAQRWSERVTWKRCLKEFQELWATGKVTNPVQPWRGLGDQ